MPDGETLGEVAARSRRVLAGVSDALRDGDVVLVGHGHALRVLTACWLRLDPAAGALFVLDAGSVSLLGHEHENQVLHGLNRPAE